ncbi:putative metalloprotease with PDZ domain [Chitinophaga skermanii]|uniref:Putative metalloprotease with PDZ domain n=1 Tax=Chitinophaga skermanii TaxID=331697 RepID=A0A327QUE9_9BACT|nr:peptidase M61 [Chitinophaga skermanii]RAJ08229.1 putative metalloprotease with PDZ domain [Chitinophaga skermanii]
MKKVFLACIASFSMLSVVNAQSYKYTLDVNQIKNDILPVSLVTPPQTSKKVIFSLPKIIPGTYAISDYGNFVDNVQAFTAAGKALPVKRLDVNRWEISNAHHMAKLTYNVEDIFDTDKKHNVYPMAATNFEENNVVLHYPGIIGFFENQGKLPFEVTINKPTNYFAATSKTPVKTTANQDVFDFTNVDDIYDMPAMYGKMDTVTIKVGLTDVLVAVYSPNGDIKAAPIANKLSALIQGAKNYLGGKLPTDRYAFLYYIKGRGLKQSFPPGLSGALEHTTSSFYYLPEMPAAALENMIVNISSHEFFHIITPLTIASKEVKEFNYDEVVLSKHLWLYEGATEYTAHHVQRKAGIDTEQQFLNKLSQKVTGSLLQYNDTLPFTTLSKSAATTYADQYGNVYQKGALISACLDVYLLHLSEGNYGLRNLMHDLGVKYGANAYFNDDEIFDEIGKLSYPAIKDFLVKYVAGNTPIPYAEYFALAGVKFSTPSSKKLIIDENASAQAKFIREKWLGVDPVMPKN